MIISLIVFTLVIVVHELGHFFAAKSFGVYVEEFAIGMGPCILKKQGKETLYTIRLFPIGGFCKMRGEDDNSSVSIDRSIESVSVYKRIIIISSGVISNIVLAVIVFTFINFNTGTSTLNISEVVEGFPAQTAGLMPGDKIIKLNNKSLLNFNELTMRISKLTEEDRRKVEILYKRDGKRIKTNVELQKDEKSGRYIIGFVPKVLSGNLYDGNTNERINVTKSITSSVNGSLFYLKYTLIGFKDLVTFKLDKSQIAGPIGIVKTMSSSYDTSVAAGGIKAGILSVSNFLAVISINIAVFNLLPIPALDGGRIVFLAIEAVTGKKVIKEKEGLIHFIGFVFLMALALFIALKDIIELF